jgi:hypothetical protein
MALLYFGAEKQRWAAFERRTADLAVAHQAQALHELNRLKCGVGMTRTGHSFPTGRSRGGPRLKVGPPPHPVAGQLLLGEVLTLRHQVFLYSLCARDAMTTKIFLAMRYR